MISHLATRGGCCAEALPGRVPPEVLDLVTAGRPVAQVVYDLQIIAQVIYTWRRQQLIDSGQGLPVQLATRVLRVSESGYYEWRAGHPQSGRCGTRG